jgi:hypothetical protein
LCTGGIGDVQLHTLLIFPINVCIYDLPLSLFIFYLHVAFSLSCIWGVEFCSKFKTQFTKVYDFLCQKGLSFLWHWLQVILSCIYGYFSVFGVVDFLSVANLAWKVEFYL